MNELVLTITLPSEVEVYKEGIKQRMLQRAEKRERSKRRRRSTLSAMGTAMIAAAIAFAGTGMEAYALPADVYYVGMLTVNKTSTEEAKLPFEEDALSVTMAPAAAVKTEQEKLYEGLADELKTDIRESAEEWSVNEAYVLAICYNETRFTPDLKNKNQNGTTDWGIAQCNDTTEGYLKETIGINSMEDVLDSKVGIDACCALLAHYKSMGLDDANALLAYQEGIGNYREIVAGRQQPWDSYSATMENVRVYSELI